MREWELTRWIANGSGCLVKENGDQQLIDRWNCEAELDLAKGLIDWDYPYELIIPSEEEVDQFYS